MYYIVYIYPIRKGIIMVITISMKKSIQLSLRVSELCKSLIGLEQKATGGSESDVVESAMIQTARSPEAAEILRKFTQEDPTLAALFAALQKAAPAKRGAGAESKTAEIVAATKRAARKQKPLSFGQ